MFNEDKNKVYLRQAQKDNGSLLGRVLSVCQSQGIQFDDPSFGPQAATPCYFRPGLPNIKWARTSQLCGSEARLFGKVDPSSLKQGLLAGPYFLSALTCLAQHPTLITRLFAQDSNCKEGVYSVWIQVDGHWREQLIDDWLPVFPNREGLSIAGTQSSDGELWPMLLEKAYAKAWGGYDTIDGGNTLHTIRDLTGAPYSVFKEIEDGDVLWERLGAATGRNWVVVCQAHNSSDWHVVSGVRGDGKVREVSISKTWIPLSTFVKDTSSMAVFMTEPSFFFNSVTSTEVQSMFSFTLSKMTDLTISLDQPDKRSRLDNDDYQLSYFRLTIGKLSEEDVLFVDSKLSAQKSFFLSDELPEGEYIVLVEAYPSDQSAPMDYTVGIYASNPTLIRHSEVSQGLFGRTEYMIWNNFARNNRSSFEARQSKQSSLDSRELSGFDFGVTLQAYFNDTADTVVLEFEQLASTGLDSYFERVLSDKRRELVVGPKDCKIVLHKINPRARAYRSGHVL
jgi:hypothetical protein